MSHAAHADAHTHGEHNPIAHVMSKRMLLGIAGVLLMLTALTVWTASFEAGRMEVIIALSIATVKAGLVAMFFMHLRYDKPLHLFMLLFSLVFVSLFLGLTVLDTQAYRADEAAWESDQIAPAAQP